MPRVKHKDVVVMKKLVCRNYGDLVLWCGMRLQDPLYWERGHITGQT